MARLSEFIGSDYWFHGERFATQLGFFRAQVVNKRWWITDPAGSPCLSLGICSMRYEGNPDPTSRKAYEESVSRRYGDRGTWAAYQAKRLRHWGFNSVGSWSDPEMFCQGLAYTVMLSVCGGGEREVSSQLWLHGHFPDVFSDAFRQGAERVAEKECAPRKNDPMLLGYFLDNELDWHGWRRGTALLDYFLAMAEEAPGKSAAVEFLRERYGGDITALNRACDTHLEGFDALLGEDGVQPGPEASLEAMRADRDAFLHLVADAYFRVSTQAVKACDPNHMTLGVRFAVHADPTVVEACGRYCEIISINNYSYEPPTEQWEAIFRATLRPIMITEWSFKAMDSGLPNTKGAAIPVYTQEGRADGYERYLTQALSLPYVVGLHWFTYTDQPATGRQLDGENSNYGVVDEDDEPYFTLVERMRVVNGRAYEIAKAAPPLPGLEPRGVPSELAVVEEDGGD